MQPQTTTAPKCICYTYAGDNPDCPVHYPKPRLNDFRTIVLLTLKDITEHVATNKNYMRVRAPQDNS